MYCPMPRGAAPTANIESHRLGSEVSKRPGQNLYSTGFRLIDRFASDRRVPNQPQRTQRDTKGGPGEANLRVTVSREFRRARFVEPKGSIGANPLKHKWTVGKKTKN